MSNGNYLEEMMLIYARNKSIRTHQRLNEFAIFAMQKHLFFWWIKCEYCRWWAFIYSIVHLAGM